jgi:hypothetical protein
MAKVEYGTVVWPHEQDICPDTLYLESKEIEKEGSVVCKRAYGFSHD